MVPAILALLLLQSPAAPTTAAPEPRGRILFTRQLHGRDDLFVLHLPDGRIERLTDHRAKDSHGVPSPDGRRIVFSSERAGWWKIWRMNADGSGIEQLTFPRSGADYSPCWSPDGLSVLYVSGSRGRGDVMRIGADGGEPVDLTDHAARDNFPAWSPTGETIAFASDRSERWALHLMDPDGGHVRCLTQEGDALEPAWFPDGRRLAYQSTAGRTEEGFHLWSLALEDGVPAGPPQRLTEGTCSDERPAVSPDGAWIVFESDRAGGSQLFLIPSTGGAPRQLTGEGYVYAPSWFPATGD